MTFNITSTTPKPLSRLDDILLYIYQVMSHDPPDSKTISEELAIRDSYFVDEIVKDLVRLGALSIDSSGRIAITDLGRELHGRGEIPGASRKQKIALCFDPVRHEFPGCMLFSESDQISNSSEDDNSQFIVRDLRFADAKRIDLDTIRRVAAAHELLSSEDAFICDAEPDETESGIQICRKEFYLFVFIDGHGRIDLDVHQPSSESATKWFRDALNECLVQGRIDFSGLFGPLAANPADDAGTNGDLDGLCPIPVHQVQEAIISAVDGADDFISMQTYGLEAGDNGHGEKFAEAIQRAAERGVRCRLLWAGTETDRYVSLHEKVEHRSVPTSGTEFMICDGNRVLAAFVSQLRLPAGDLSTRVLTVGESKEPSICRRLCQAFEDGWQAGEARGYADAAVETPLQNQKSPTTSTATPTVVQAGKEM
jgi:hypothetical protein